MGNRLSVKSKLVVILLLVGLLSTVVTGFLGWRQTSNILETGIFNQLVAVRTAKAAQVQNYFVNMRNQVEVLSNDDMIIQAMVTLNKSFRTLQYQTITPEMDKTLETFYVEQFFPKLFGVLPGQADYALYRPGNQAGHYLQTHYIANNPYSNDLEKMLFDTATDGSRYSEDHAYYHPRLRNIVQKLGFDDLLLVNAETGDVVYSVAKQIDFASNLDFGPLRKSNIAILLDTVRNNADRGTTQLTDFELYRPAYGYPAAFWGVPIYNGGHLIGVLIVQISLNQVNDMMTYKGEWSNAGLGSSGETYLVGRDGVMRSNSRFLLEDKATFLQTLSEAAVPQPTIDLINKMNTSILLQNLDTAVVGEIAQGKMGAMITNDYRGMPVLSAYQPLFLEGLRWGLLAEIDEAEAFAPIYQFQNQLLISTVLIILLGSFLALIVTNYFMKPLKTIVNTAQQLSEGNYDVELKLTSQDEWGELGKSINHIGQSIRQQSQQLSKISQAHERLLLNLLPSALARRVQKGETAIVDQVQQVSVLFATLYGVSELSTQKSAQTIVEILQEISSDWDEAAARYDVESLRSPSQHLLGVCGFSVSRLDHSRRMIDFALLAQQSVQRINRKHSTHLDLRMGIHAGVVHVGVFGINKMIYEMWGDTVGLANALAEEAPANTILVSQEVYDRLHEQYTFRRQREALRSYPRLTNWVVEGVKQMGKESKQT